MNTKLLTADSVTKTYGATTALDGVSLDVGAGEVVALVGENGAGKSTMVRLLSGTESPTSGSVTTDRGPLVAGRPRSAQEAGIAVIHQELTYVGTMTVEENLALGRFPRRGPLLDRQALRAFAVSAMAAIDPSINIRQRMDRLSIGARQLVEIARAVATDPRVLLLDEPTAALSTEEADRLFEVLDDLKARGIGMLYISHRLQELARVADRILILRDGRLVAEHTPDVDRGTLVEDIVGRQLQAVQHQRREVVADDEAELADGPPLLRLSGLSSESLDPLDLDVPAGHVVGLYGLPGSGVEDVAYAMVGERSAGGVVVIDGQEFGADRNPVALRRAGFALVPSDRREEGLFESQSVSFNIAVGGRSMMRLWRRASLRSELELAREQIDEIDIRPGEPRTAVGALSGGNQQKSIFARWLAIEPRVLVLDQPTRGVDVGAKAQIYQLIQRAAQRGAAVLIVSPEPDELLTACTHIGVIHQGQLTTYLDSSSLDEDHLVAAALSGEDT